MKKNTRLAPSKFNETLEMYKSLSLAQIFSRVNPNVLQRYFMDDYEQEMRQRALFTHPESIEVLNPRFTCERELVIDTRRTLDMHDGFTYWRSTGRLLVTWYDGSITAIEYYEPKHSPVVIDCGYDEEVPF